MNKNIKMISPPSKWLLVTFTFIATAITGLSTSLPAQVIFASVEEVNPGSNDSEAIMKFKQHKDNPTQIPIGTQGEAIDHINQAQSALQNGDTVGAQSHLDLAKQALGCNPGDPAHC
ncbi:MAG: hypothetical protein ACRD47_06150 [Nitrososphaeraceae archaeon]